MGTRLSGSFDGLPIRVRLAGVSALLTFVILCAFALAIGSITVHRIRTDFNHEVLLAADQLPGQLTITGPPLKVEPALKDLAPAGSHAVIKIYTTFGELIESQPSNAPNLGAPSETLHTVDGYRVVSREAIASVGNRRGRVIIEYGRKLSDTEETVGLVELLLVGGVLAGTGLALLAGMAIARRAMAPIASLTATAAEIARTRDPSRAVPEPGADDEVAELARTLQGMLHELDAARAESDSALERQRRFVADASHELRTPLTSVLANLELLADSLRGEQGEAAQSALRSSQRMRRLVADLLLLARSDASREIRLVPCELDRVVVDAAAELEPVSGGHEIVLELHGARVAGSRDDLQRMVTNLIENALRHTPSGTQVTVSTETVPGAGVRVIVQDDGPGVPDSIAPVLFERFVRGAGDRGGSFGLGLAIVQAVASAHGGDVQLERGPQVKGARFVVTLPALSDLDDDRQDHRAAPQTVVDQLG